MSVALAAVLALMALQADAQPAEGPCAAQVASLSRDEFIACARAGTEKYLDRSAAVLDGYRRIGRDFPGMGEHWIRVSLVFDGRFDPARPEILTYVLIGGIPRLLGVAYAVPLLRGEKPPDGPAGPEAWHDHSRTVEDETVLPHHHTHGSAGDGARLAMLHAWIWSSNPDGMFAADNWAIPFLRLGLTPAAETRPAVARALALAAGGRTYFEMAIDVGAALSAAEKSRVTHALEEAEAEAEEVVRVLEGPVLGDSAETQLAGIWTRLWTAIDAALGEDARAKLRHLPIR